VDGHGVAIGRFPLVDRLLVARQLATPLKRAAVSTDQGRAYWLIVAAAARPRADVRAFADWLRAQIAQDQGAAVAPTSERRRARSP
jgi:DNA-binding transcriptional LysR family regulator